MDGTTSTGTWQQWSTRLLALLGLAAVVVAILVVVGGSIDSSRDDGKKRGDRGGKQEQQQSGEDTYVVQPGDNLSTIADSANLSEERLLELNPDVDPQTLQPGQTLKLRPG